jgi:hypothetical protein
VLAGPFRGWRGDLAGRPRAHRNVIALAAVPWLAAAIYFDAGRIPFRPNVKGLALLLALAAVALAWGIAGRVVRARTNRRLLLSLSSGFNGALVAALLVGIIVPVVVVLDDGLRSLPWVATALLGRGVNSGVTPLSDTGQLLSSPLVEALGLYALAAAGAMVAARRRDWTPMLWFVSATVMGALAVGRLGTTHYFAPAYTLAIVPALGALRALGRGAPVAVAAALALIIAPQIPSVRRDLAAPAISQPTIAALPHFVRPGEVALTDPSEPLPDTLYASLLARYVEWAPPYPYRTLPTDVQAQWAMRVEHLRPRWYLSRRPLPAAAASTAIGDYTVSVRRPSRVGDYLAYRVLDGPGVDRPLPRSRPPGAPTIAAP